jgi:hypothetical protein
MGDDMIAFAAERLIELEVGGETATRCDHTRTSAHRTPARTLGPSAHGGSDARGKHPSHVFSRLPLRSAGFVGVGEQKQSIDVREKSRAQTVTPAMVHKFARAARERLRLNGGGYHRDHLQALAQRVEVAKGEVRIMGSEAIC